METVNERCGAKFARYCSVVICFLALSMSVATADVLLDTLPANDQANFSADCGQTWMTGTLGRSNKLSAIEVATRSAGDGGGAVYLAVYENQAASGDSANWIVGDLVGVSLNSQDMDVNGVVNTFNFDGERLTDNSRYLYMFVDASTNGVAVGTGVKLNAGGADHSAYTAGGLAFSGAHAMASRITAHATVESTIMNTLPRNDDAHFFAQCGQTWKTGNLGSVNRLKSIEVATRAAAADGGDVYLAVYKNSATNGAAASWIPGNLVGVSQNSQNMSTNGVVNTFNFRSLQLSDNSRYLYMFVDDSVNAVDISAGVRLNSGTAEQAAYTAGGLAFSGSHTLASRITTTQSQGFYFTTVPHLN